MNTYFIGIDIGTSSTKLILFSKATQEIVFQKVVNYPFEIIKGKIRIKSDLILNAVMSMLKETAEIIKLEKTRYRGSEIYIILDTMLHSLILLDKNMEPLTEIIPWMDETGKEIAEEILLTDVAREIHFVTGCPVATTYPLYKLIWISKNERDVLEKASKIASIKDFIVYKLTGNHVVDESIASGSGCYNIRGRRWAKEILLELTDVSDEFFPHVVPFYEKFEPSKELKMIFGSDIDLKIVVGTSDGAASSMGTTLGNRDFLTISMGTSAAIRRVMDAAPPKELMPGYGPWCYIFDEEAYIVGSATNNCGNVINWWNNKYFNLGDFSPFENAIRSLLNVSESVIREGKPIFRPTVFGMRSIRWLPDQTAEFYNITGKTGLEDMTMAVLEGLAFKFRRAVDAVTTLTSNYMNPVKAYVVTGGLLQMKGWAEFLATILGKDLVCQRDRFDTAMGSILMFLRKNDESFYKKVAEKEIVRSKILPIYDKISDYQLLYEVWLSKMEHVEKEYLDTLIHK